MKAIIKIITVFVTALVMLAVPFCAGAQDSTILDGYSADIPQELDRQLSAAGITPQSIDSNTLSLDKVVSNVTGMLWDSIQSPLVSNENDNTGKVSDKKDSDIVSASANTEKVADSSEEYFAKARIDKQASREEAKETLKSIYGGGDMTKDELAVVAQDAQQLTDLMEAENKIETTLKAQGFEDVLCYLSDNSANIIVKSQGLDTAQAAQIKSALLSEVEVAGENITIVEVQ